MKIMSEPRQMGTGSMGIREGNGTPLHYSCLENPTDGGAWQVTVHGVLRVRYNLATKPCLRVGSLDHMVILCVVF